MRSVKCLTAFNLLKNYSKIIGSLVSVTSFNCHQSTCFIITTSAVTPSCHCCKGTIWRAATLYKHPASLWWLQWINRVKLMWKFFECHWYWDYVYLHQLWIGDIWVELPKSLNVHFHSHFLCVSRVDKFISALINYFLFLWLLFWNYPVWK